MSLMRLRRDSTASGGTTGVTLNLTMQGDGIYNCAYTIPVYVGVERNEYSVQVDTGSSDIWLTSTSCSSRPCTSGPASKYDSSKAQATGQTLNLAYQRGSVSGPIVLDTFELGGYVVTKQALAAASDIENENLAVGAGLNGLLGLALPANSIISNQLSSTSFSEDALTFIGHLFGGSDSVSNMPQNRFVSIMMERPFYPFIPSRLGIGVHPELPYSLSSSAVQFSDILPSNPGPLLWRVPVTRITIDVGGSKQYVGLGGTQATGVYSIYPVVIFDSGGSSMIATRSLANAIYGIWGIGPGQDDGQYYVPCNFALNVTLTVGTDSSIDLPIHPLDMSYDIPSQPESATCLGALQASDTPLAQGDLILGAAFMRNVYTVMSWNSNPPKLGVLSLTNETTAAAEFHTARVLKQPLGTSQSQQGSVSSSSNTGTSTGGDKSTVIGLSVLGAVLGFLLLAGLAIFFGVRAMRNRWKREGERQVDKPPDLEPKSRKAREKYHQAARKTVFGLDVDEAFTMYSSGLRSGREPEDDKTSVVSHSHDGHTRNTTTRDDEEDVTSSQVDLRPRYPPYESVDNLWSGENMTRLRDSRYHSVYSVHSMGSKASSAALGVEPVAMSDQQTEHLPRMSLSLYPPNPTPGRH